MVYFLAIYQNIRNIIASQPNPVRSWRLTSNGANRPRRTRNLILSEPFKSQLIVPADIVECHRIRPYLNRRLADYSYRRNQ